MIATFIKSQNLRVYLLLLLSSIFSITLLLVRILHLQETRYLFLVWNLFLAIVPLGAVLLYKLILFKKARKRWLLFPLSLWLFFLPNAPYILTDLFHLKGGVGIAWLDLMIILSFAWTGLVAGLFSLQQMQTLVANKWGVIASHFFATGVLFLSAFGVYLGRYLRWNSWDLVYSPKLVLSDIVNRFIVPWEYTRTWGVTLALGSFLCIVYFTVYTLQQVKYNEPYISD